MIKEITTVRMPIQLKRKLKKIAFKRSTLENKVTVTDLIIEAVKQHVK